MGASRRHPALPTLIVALAVGLAACGSLNPARMLESRQTKLDAWKGENGDYLLQTWGEPERVNDLPSGGRELTYIQGASADNPNCLVLFRVTPFNLVSAAELLIDEGGCSDFLIYPER